MDGCVLEGEDRFDIRLTTGSNGSSERPLANVVRDGDGWRVTLHRPDGTQEELSYR